MAKIENTFFGVLLITGGIITGSIWPIFKHPVPVTQQKIVQVSFNDKVVLQSVCGNHKMNMKYFSFDQISSRDEKSMTFYFSCEEK